MATSLWYSESEYRSRAILKVSIERITNANNFVSIYGSYQAALTSIRTLLRFEPKNVANATKRACHHHHHKST